VAWNKFKSDQRGSIAVVSAVSISVILLLTGIALDYTSMTNTQNKLQNAADSAALAAAVSGEYEVAELKAIATETAAANYSGEFDLNLELLNSGESLTVEISANYPLMFMGIESCAGSRHNLVHGRCAHVGYDFCSG